MAIDGANVDGPAWERQPGTFTSYSLPASWRTLNRVRVGRTQSEQMSSASPRKADLASIGPVANHSARKRHCDHLSACLASGSQQYCSHNNCSDPCQNWLAQSWVSTEVQRGTKITARTLLRGHPTRKFCQIDQLSAHSLCAHDRFACGMSAVLALIPSSVIRYTRPLPSP
jgi:hypothetical protein